MVMEVTGGRLEQEDCMQRGRKRTVREGIWGETTNSKGHLWGHMETYFVEAS